MTVATSQTLRQTPESSATGMNATITGKVRTWLLSPKGELWSSIVAGSFLLVGFLLSFTEFAPFGRGLYWLSLGIGLIHGIRAAWDSLSARKFDIDVLMAVGALLAAWLGHPEEGALLLFLFVLAGALEALAMARTTRAVESLHALMPTRALRLDLAPDGAERFVEVAPEQLKTGDVVKIPPGESIPTDAVVLDGQGSVNQASLTGESMPRSVAPGDSVFAGTINVGNPLRVKVSKPVGESSLQKILDLVISAQQQREPVQRFIDKVSEPYALGVLGASILVFLIWWLALATPAREALVTAITLLIVMSPCAVIIATPTATLCGISRGARGGLLFKGGQAIERLARLKAVAFDKTGTLTIGKMRVGEVHPVGWSDDAKLLAVAAGLEQDSTHPIAAAICQSASQRGLAPTHVDSPTFTAGRGVGGMIDGTPARLGNFAYTSELVPVCLRARVQEVLSGVQQQGQIGVVVTHDQQAGVIILSDTTRPGAEELVAQLHELNVRPVVMLTGDNAQTAHAVGDRLKLDQVHAQMLPSDKLDAVEKLKAEARRTTRGKGGAGVIGDGVNDAPALAAADVSIAIGSIGSDAALESADIVLLSDDLRSVPWAVGLARRVRRTVLFNLTIALGAIVLMAIATLVGSRIGKPLPLWMGVLGHEGGTLLVVFNSLLLLAYPGLKQPKTPK